MPKEEQYICARGEQQTYARGRTLYAKRRTLAALPLRKIFG